MDLLAQSTNVRVKLSISLRWNSTRLDSDIDVMVSFEANDPWGLLEFVRIKRELETLLGREVDLVTKNSIEQSHHWIRRREILGTAQTVYVAR